jgi:hypothetical protein
MTATASSVVPTVSIWAFSAAHAPVVASSNAGTYRWTMAEPEVFDWDEWENGKAYQLSNDELVGALFAEVSALRKRVKALEDRQPR